MTKIFEILFAILICFAIYKVIFYTFKRTRAIYKISTLKKSSGAKINYTRMPFASYFKLSKKPDVTVEIGDTVYLVRLLNGKNGSGFMHFASPEYFVTYSKMRFSLGGLMQIKQKYKVTRAPGFLTTSKHSVKILPALEIPEKYNRKSEYDERKIIPVLILNPAPYEVSYVTKERTSIKVAFTGDEIYGQKIFTAATFVTYADRMKRQSEYEKALII